MRAVLQRVSSASVTLAGASVPIGAIGSGLVVLLGVAPTDTDTDAHWLAEKICALRLFPDADGKMNLSVRDLSASVSQRSSSDSQPPLRSDHSTLNPHLSTSPLLIISQFTLFASTRKGTRPSWDAAARPDIAIPLYEAFVRHATHALGHPVATGRFGADMKVSLTNDGPVTLIIDSSSRE